MFYRVISKIELTSPFGNQHLYFFIIASDEYKKTTCPHKLSKCIEETDG